MKEQSTLAHAYATGGYWEARWKTPSGIQLSMASPCAETPDDAVECIRLAGGLLTIGSPITCEHHVSSYMIDDIVVLGAEGGYP